MKVHWLNLLLFIAALVVIGVATKPLGWPWWCAGILGGVLGGFWPWKVVEFRL